MGGSRKDWTHDEIARLKRMYPSEPMEDVLRAIPRHAIRTIMEKASRLNIRRLVRSRYSKRLLHPVFETLRQARYDLLITQEKVAEAAGIHAATIWRHENGFKTGAFDNLVAWAQTLGFELVVRRVGESDFEINEKISDFIKLDPTENVVRNGVIRSDRLAISEFKIMRELIEHAPFHRTKEQLHYALYGDDIDGGAEMKIIDAFVCKLRKKIACTGVEIVTKWGEGYFARMPKRQRSAA